MQKKKANFGFKYIILCHIIQYAIISAYQGIVSINFYVRVKISAREFVCLDV